MVHFLLVLALALVLALVLLLLLLLLLVLVLLAARPLRSSSHRYVGVRRRRRQLLRRHVAWVR
jgi:hypothetical protein